MGRDDSEMLSAYAPRYQEFSNDGKAMGAYGKRWTHNPGIACKGRCRSSLRVARDLLLKKVEDRRAVVTMFDSGDIVEAERGEWKDIPCTISMQFLAREGALHAQVSMRSNDAWLGVPYDVHCFCQVQALMAAALDLDLGQYTHVVGSMHLYEPNFEKASHAVSGQEVSIVRLMSSPSQEEAEEFFDHGVPPWVVDIEKQFREKNFARLGEVIEGSVGGCWWSEKLAACALKLGAKIEDRYLPRWMR
jgi:thymidylate synthase